MRLLPQLLYYVFFIAFCQPIYKIFLWKAEFRTGAAAAAPVYIIHFQSSLFRPGKVLYRSGFQTGSMSLTASSAVITASPLSMSIRV